MSILDRPKQKAVVLNKSGHKKVAPPLLSLTERARPPMVIRGEAVLKSDVDPPGKLSPAPPRGSENGVKGYLRR